MYSYYISHSLWSYGRIKIISKLHDPAPLVKELHDKKLPTHVVHKVKVLMKICYFRNEK